MAELSQSELLGYTNRLLRFIQQDGGLTHTEAFLTTAQHLPLVIMVQERASYDAIN